MIRLIKTRQAAQRVLDDALKGHPEYYAVAQVTNAMGENLWFMTSTAQELASVMQKAASRSPNDAGVSQRTAEVLWTKDAGLTEDGEAFVPGEPEESLWDSVVDREDDLT